MGSAAGHQRPTGSKPLSRRSFLRTAAQAAAVGAAAATATTAVSACTATAGGTSFADVKESGKILIGVAGEKPYGYIDEDGRVTGEGPEVARAVLKRLGITELQGVLVDFRQLIPGLQAQKYSLVAAGMSILPERCADAAFSLPDFEVKNAFLVQKGNPEGIETFADIKGKDVLIGVLTGGVELELAIEAGAAEEQLVTLGDQDSLFRAVADGRVYGAATLDTTVGYLLKQHPEAGLSKTKPFVPPGGSAGVGGFAFRKHDTEFVKAFNAELAALKKSGEWLEIVRPFGFTEQHQPGPEITTKKLCAP
ncbi:ectoine/hydroxyectoine ABC transporter substrate-binding protein EhuB [Thermocrispum municipale]|jgi:polar amino acid transport system substrate-binding protein|uniref:ectoine/hydroxyectoine ABC transporter substrate-binding protein EhuB n=1 Tax=Thermocrispum municipale TaxID=37926 RepID=UPI0009FE2DCC|nr:ectoine/hydroxyectoine ABC transporter substrate-binding protein EhuB [Thermocrispum municipale]